MLRGVDPDHDETAVRQRVRALRGFQQEPRLAAERRNLINAVWPAAPDAVEVDAAPVGRPARLHLHAVGAVMGQHGPASRVRIHDRQLRLSVDDGREGQQVPVGGDGRGHRNARPPEVGARPLGNVRAAVDKPPSNCDPARQQNEGGSGHHDAPLGDSAGWSDAVGSGLAHSHVVANLAQLLKQIPGRIVPLLRVLRQAPFDGPAQRRRDRWRQRLGILVNDRRHRFGSSRTPECCPPGKHLVDHQAKRELVSAEVYLLSPRLLRTHIGSGARDRPRSAQRERCGFSIFASVQRSRRNPKVEDLHPAIAAHHDIRRLQVTMNKARLVRRRQTIGHLNGRIQHLAHIVGTADWRAVDILHHDVVVTDIVDLGHVWMVQRGNRACLALDPLGELCVWELDRYRAAQPCIVGLPNLAHAARPERGKQFIRPESFSLCPHGLSFLANSGMAEYTPRARHK